MYPKNINDADTYADLLARMGRLSADSAPQWGKMNAAQMLAHCAEVQEVTNGKALKGTPFYIRMLGPLVKRMVLSTRPYPHDSPTHPQYVMSGPVEFDAAKARCRASLEALRARGGQPVPHSLFGPMKAEEWGWSVWKHLDHHLRQFGV